MTQEEQMVQLAAEFLGLKEVPATVRALAAAVVRASDINPLKSNRLAWTWDHVRAYQLLFAFVSTQEVERRKAS